MRFRRSARSDYPGALRLRLWRQLRALVFLAAALALAYHFSRPEGGIGPGRVEVADPARVRVIDGDTLAYAGDRIRIAGIDAPEINPPRCPAEAELGLRAKQRLAELVAAGPFELVPTGRDEDKYGRKLRHAVRAGRSFGAILVAEALARPSRNGRAGWC